MEALILTLDVFCMTYLCWRIFKMDEKSAKHPNLGPLSYKPPSQE